MSDAMFYVKEKLGTATYVLATDMGSMQDRLYAAWMGFHTLTSADFANSELRRAFDSIDSRLSAVSIAGSANGSVRDTLDQMSDDEAKLLAHDIWTLNSHVRDWIENSSER